MTDAKSISVDQVRRVNVEGVVVGALWAMAATGLVGLGLSAFFRWAPDVPALGAAQTALRQLAPLPLGAALAAIAAVLGYRSGARRGH